MKSKKAAANTLGFLAITLIMISIFVFFNDTQKNSVDDLTAAGTQLVDQKVAGYLSHNLETLSITGIGTAGNPINITILNQGDIKIKNSSSTYFIKQESEKKICDGHFNSPEIPKQQKGTILISDCDLTSYRDSQVNNTVIIILGFHQGDYIALKEIKYPLSIFLTR